MKPYIVRNTQMTVLPEGAPLFAETATTVTIVDESGGEFVVVEQNGRDGSSGRISISSEDWEKLRYAIDMLIIDCREEVK